MHLRAGENSTISYIVPMIASLRGYEPLTEVHLDTVTVTSSLNDIRLLSAESCRVSVAICSKFPATEFLVGALRIALSPEMERGAAVGYCSVTSEAGFIPHQRAH